MIKKVINHYGKQNIPPAIKEFIILRVKYQDVSLTKLGELADPPLSKSAINGRLRRLEKMASSI